MDGGTKQILEGKNMIEAKDLTLKVEKHVPGELVTNALKIKAFVEERLKDYDPEKYLDIEQAKKDRAVLNAASKELNSKRLELERKFMEPFEEFKKIIKETTVMIDLASSKIDAIVKSAEEEERRIKRAEIEALYEKIGLDIVPLEKIWDARWLNKTKKMQDIEKEIIEKKEKILCDLKVINSLEDKEEIIAYYLETMDISSAMEQAERIKEMRERAKAVKEATLPDSPQIVKPEQEVNAVESEPTLEYVLKVRGTKSALLELRACMERLGITYEKVETL